MTAPMYEPEEGSRPIAPVSWYSGGEGQARRPGAVLLGIASLLLVALAVAQGYVSWRAQFAFIDAAKHARLPSALEALGLDAGAVIFALLALAHARMGRPARIERVLNLACAFGSMTMNLLGADLTSPRSVAVYVLPAVLYAACSDRLITTAGHLAGVEETSVWRFAGTGAKYGLRAMVALPSTVTGGRRALLAATPLPAADDGPAVPEVHGPAPEHVPAGVPRAALAAVPAARTRQPTRARTPDADMEREQRRTRALERIAATTGPGDAPGVRVYKDAYGLGQDAAVARRERHLAELEAQAMHEAPPALSGSQEGSHS
jgi:hypothetical protein